MSDIFREVDEDVRRDRALQFFQKYQTLFVIGGIVVVLATAGWRTYSYWHTRMVQAASAHYETAITASRSGDAQTALNELERLVRKGTAGYRTLARLRDAGEIGKRDPAAGAQAFDALAVDASIGPIFQDAARLRAAILLMDSADPKDIRGRLEPMAASGSTFRHTARELLALNALKANDGDAAGHWLDMVVVDPESPPDLRKRAEALLGLVRGAKPATG